MTLPPEFKSLYRLARRTSASAVIHHKSATLALRHLWRRPFENAASVLKQSEASPAREDLRLWLDNFHKRVDNTLYLLHNSSLTRGLPHNVTKTIAGTLYHHVRALSEPHLPKWDPQALDHKPPISRQEATKLSDKQRLNSLGERALRACGRVVRMAEGRDQILLGTVKAKARIAGGKKGRGTSVRMWGPGFHN
ncbi:hypothetical protein CYLTODRAFT_442407 [Cylindrobasidium torrendii FP15055 ss-10]|uniref:Uncharacterized protein n=1 Tax=Cylindrobasidium torrendii FP15055 ss-10 TaxID=1314674 RepID=A0A0D7BI36_9AGAR|nr:hypothetical protein CYLTODRAFT_442407 [Cylindrobasidium torrendii FP15055 ss-10]